MKGNNLLNMTFNRLKVIEKTNNRSGAGSVIWKCICDCETIVYVESSSLKSGHTKSCGCIKRELCEAGLRLIHGHRIKINTTGTYRTWRKMKDRCYNKKENNYHNYGGRGIKVCDRWKNSFENFLKDMGERPYNKSIDRINNNGNYEPSNCKWSTISEQQNNKRNTSEKRRKAKKA